LRAEVDRLGPVRHLVSPNKLHQFYLQDWAAAYPEAQMWGPQSTIRKRADLEFREALQDTPPSEWASDIDQAWFRGSFAMDEIVFFHRPSSTVIVADLIQTFSDRFLREHWGWWRFMARLDGLTEKQAGAPREWRASFINRAPARRPRPPITIASSPRRRTKSLIASKSAWTRGTSNSPARKMRQKQNVHGGISSAPYRPATKTPAARIQVRRPAAYPASSD